MKVQELKNTQLRRLNKVLHNGVIKTIDCITPGYVTFLEDRPNSDNFGEWVDLDEIEFIELTEEILLKCGFIKKDGYFYYLYSKIIISETFVFLDIDIYVKIKHLHQFQNIVHALTNQELQINL